MIAKKRELTGVVVSDKMDKTVVVRVSHRVKSRLVEKYFVKTKKFKAHDEADSCKAGDKVVIKECPPLSREKRWSVIRVLEKGGELT